MDMINGNNPIKKITRGRQKIEIKKIVNKQSRQVTFTKRRNGVFKKASELCILTGADVAVFVKSRVGRLWTFGSPNVESVVDKYFSGGGGGGGRSESEEAIIKELNRLYDDVGKDLEAEKRKKALLESGVANNDRFWWEEPIEGLGLDELEFYVAALEELKNKVSMKTDQMMIMTTSNSIHYPSPNLAINPINSENSSESTYNYNHYVNQPHDSASTSSFLPSGYVDFGFSEQLN